MAGNSARPPNGGEIDIAGRIHGTQSEIRQTLCMDDHIIDVDKGNDDAGIEIHLPRFFVESVAFLDLGGRSFWTSTRAVTTPIQRTLMAPRANRMAIRPALEPTHSRP